MADDINNIWNRYKKTKDIDTRNELVLHYDSLVDSIAKKTLNRMKGYTDILSLDDVKISGTIGLIDAIEKYDETKNANFKTYAWYRIKGTILDEFRKLNKKVPLANIDGKIVRKNDDTIKIIDIIEDKSDNDILSIIENEEKIEVLNDIIDKLPDRDKKIINLYYHEKMKLKDIGKLFNISAARASYIRRETEKKLKIEFKKLGIESGI